MRRAFCQSEPDSGQGVRLKLPERLRSIANDFYGPKIEPDKKEISQAIAAGSALPSIHHRRVRRSRTALVEEQSPRRPAPRARQTSERCPS